MGQLFSSQAAPGLLRHGKKRAYSRPKNKESFEAAGKTRLSSSPRVSRNQATNEDGVVSTVAKTRSTPQQHSILSSRSTALELSNDERPHDQHDVSAGAQYQSHKAEVLHSATSPTQQAPTVSPRPNYNSFLGPKQRRECKICSDTRSLRHFPNRPPTAQCTHELDVCSRCLRTWITTQFATKTWHEITCPLCPSSLQHKDIRDFAPSRVFKRYDRLYTRAALEAIPGFTWCISKRCKSGQVQARSSARFRCEACKKSHCTEHGVAWHKGETCKEYEYRTNKKWKKAEESASMQMIAQIAKKCPGCRTNIERSYGCDRMTCGMCRTEFCWQCLARYDRRAFPPVLHRPGCTFFEPERVQQGD